MIDQYMQRVESVACKRTVMDHWYQDYSQEAHLTRRLNAAGCKNVIKVFDWQFFRIGPGQNESFYKILYEYCPHGTLRGLFRFYSSKW